MTKNQSFIEMLEEIRFKEKLNQQQIAKRLQVSSQYISDVKNGRFPLTDELRERIYEEFTYLRKDKIDASPIPAEQTHVRIPLVSQYAYAGYLGGFADQEYLEMLPTIDFMPDREMTGNYVAFEVRGDSMDDGSKESYEQGEILVCREVEPYNWQYSPLHINKRDFVVVHTGGILVKRIINHDVTNHTITIHSLNPEYEDRIIDLADVRQIFSIIESRKQRRR